jgi:prepilin-type processing-associated H-X9-DG protein
MRMLCLCVLVVVLNGALARAQTLADRVPGDAIAYVGWKGADTPDNGYAGSHLQAVIDASGFAQLRDQLVPQFMQKITQQSNDHGQRAQAMKTMLEIFWRHPAAAFFAGTTKDAAGAPAPRLGVICQAGSDGDALLTIFNAAAHGPGAPPLARAYTAGDCTVFLIGYDNDAIPAVADAGKSLQATEGFVRMSAQTGKDPFICGYLDVSRAIAQIDNAVASSGDDQMKDIWPKARDASGLAGIKHVSFADGFDGKDWQSQMFVEAPAPRTGLLMALEPTRIDPALLARIPSTVATAMLGQFNFGEFLKQARAVTIAANPTAGGLFDKGMGLVQMMIGRSLQQDILGPLGAQWAIYADASIPASTMSISQPPMQGNNVVVVNKLVDPAKASQGWTMLSYAISNASAGWIRSNHMPLSMAMSKNGDQAVYTIVSPMVQPSWTMKDGFMYFGLSPQGVIAAANRASGAPITALPAFADLEKQLDPSGNFSGFEFANLPVSVPQAYPAAEAGLNQLRTLAQQQSINLPEHILPALEKLLPELTPALNVSWADENGWHSRSREPFPGATPQFSAGTIGGAALGVSILLPALNRGRETANRIKCASNERQIGQACLLYSNDHKGKYPDNLGELLSAGDVGPEVFLCPSSNTSLPSNYKTMAPADLAKWITDHGDYVYVGSGMTTAAPDDAITLYEKPEDHKQGMNILFGDGHVEFDLMTQAVKMIRDQHKSVPTVPLPTTASPDAPDAAPVVPTP